MNISAQCALKLTLMFTDSPTFRRCEYKSELGCSLSTGIHIGSYHNVAYHGAGKKLYILEDEKLMLKLSIHILFSEAVFFYSELFRFS